VYQAGFRAPASCTLAEHCTGAELQLSEWTCHGLGGSCRSVGRLGLADASSMAGGSRRNRMGAARQHVAGLPWRALPLGPGRGMVSLPGLGVRAGVGIPCPLLGFSRAPARFPSAERSQPPINGFNMTFGRLLPGECACRPACEPKKPAYPRQPKAETPTTPHPTRAQTMCRPRGPP